eukprot:4502929-Heterocapsa_arctica.AAC.1
MFGMSTGRLGHPSQPAIDDFPKLINIEILPIIVDRFVVKPLFNLLDNIREQREDQVHVDVAMIVASSDDLGKGSQRPRESDQPY